MEALTPWHLLLILIAFVLLGGYKKLPDAARSVGRSLRIFRGEMRTLDGEGPPAALRSPTSDQAGGTTAAPTEPAQPPTVSAADLEREAATAEELAARLRARAAATPESPPAVS
jgi:sec-independent protein translocase protein TatA